MRLICLAVLVDAAIILLTPTTALAAMHATLSSTHARPGDSVLLLTDDHNGTWTYDGLSSENQQPIYLAPTTGDWANACGGAGSQMVGRLHWRGNAAGVSFIIPSLPLTDYWLFMETQGQCWRIVGLVGELAGPLVLSIGTVSADNQELAGRWTVDSLPVPKRPATAPPGLAPPWLAIAVGGLLVFVAAVALARRARHL
jgi:hypothetical protein